MANSKDYDTVFTFELGDSVPKGNYEDKIKDGKDGRARAIFACAVTKSTRFPKDAVGLDNWANIWVIHQKRPHPEGYKDVLQLAYGDCQCHRDVGKKGVPRAFVKWREDGDNIDLFPHGFLHRRGCGINYSQTGDAHIVSPKNRNFPLKHWDYLGQPK